MAACNVGRMRTRSPGLTREHPIRERPIAGAAVVAAVTAAITPYVCPAVATAAPSPTDTGSFRTADLRALMDTRAESAARSDRSSRELYPAPPRHVRAAAVQVAVAPPLPPAPVKTYTPRHSTAVKTAHYTKTGNSSSRYAPPVAASGRAEAAILYALGKLGRPYVYGATGPNAFDCSGLTQAAYRAAGVSLPRTAAQISSRGVSIPHAQWQPGDILYWGGRGSAYHVAIYLGGGQMVEAAHPGTDVRRVSVWGSPGAVRV